MEGHIDHMYQILYHQVASKLPFSQTLTCFSGLRIVYLQLALTLVGKSLGSLIFRTKESFKVTANKNKITASTH